MSGASFDSGAAGIKAFLIADVRGYTLFTQERGDEAAAKLAARFAAVAREGVAARGGEVIELRGDEALAVFDSPRQAIRAAVDLQDRFVEETLADPSIPLMVGIGLDAGEAVPVEAGYRGRALNLGARLCGQAGPGEIVASQEIVHLAHRIDGVRYAGRGQLRLKGLSEPVSVVRVSSAEADAAERLRPIMEARPPESEPPRKPSEVTRRRALIAAVALAVVAAAIAIPLSLRGGASGCEDSSVATRPNSVGRLDPSTCRLLADTPLESAPGELASGAGGVWVTEPDIGTVAKIDPEDGKVVAKIDVGVSPSGIAVGAGSVWVVNSGDPSVSRISPATDAVVQEITEGVGNGADDIAVSEDAIWVTNRIDGTVSRFDARSGELVKTIPVSDTPTGIFADEEEVWVARPGTGTLQQIDPKSNEAIDSPVHVGNWPGAVESDGAAIWVANTLDATVSRVDPESGSVQTTIPVGEGPAAIAFSPGAVWVPGEFSGTITRIDVRTGQRETIHLSSQPQGVAVAHGSLWIAARGAASGHRGGTLEVIGDNFEFDSIDPAIAYSGQSWQILTLTNDGLLTFTRVGGTEGGTLVPDLARRLVSPADGGLTYRYELRPGLTYSTGEPVRASDFRRALERGFEIRDRYGSLTAVPSLYHNLLGASRCRPGRPSCDLSRAIETDDKAGAVTYHLSRPDPSFPFKLALPFSFPVPEGTPPRDIGPDPVPATGPYEISSYERGKELVLERNSEFQEWSAAAQPDGFPDHIRMTFGTKAGPAVDAVESGRVDYYAGRAPSDRVQELITLFADRVHGFPLPITNYWSMNTELPPFNDIRVRRAVNFAVDRAAIAKMYGPQGARVTCQDLPPNFPGYVPYCPYTADPSSGGQWIGPDMDRARKLIRESGAAGTPVTIWFTDQSEAQQEAGYAARLLTKLGLPAHVHHAKNLKEWFRAVYVSPSRVQFSINWWAADFSAATNFISNQFTCDSKQPEPGNSINVTQLCNRELDRKVRAAEAADASDPQAAGRLWAETDRALVDLAPAVFVATPWWVDVVSARVGNYQWNPEWGVLLDQLWVR
jgi:YVTN family beta-propeller protein